MKNQKFSVFTWRDEEVVDNRLSSDIVAVSWNRTQNNVYSIIRQPKPNIPPPVDNDNQNFPSPPSIERFSHTHTQQNPLNTQQTLKYPTIASVA